jgi:hypothetical protein
MIGQAVPTTGACRAGYKNSRKTFGLTRPVGGPGIASFAGWVLTDDRQFGFGSSTQSEVAVCGGFQDDFTA